MEEKWTWNDTRIYCKMMWCRFLSKVCKGLVVCAEHLKDYVKRLMAEVNEEIEEEKDITNNE